MADLNLVEDLYHRLEPVLDALTLNHEGIAYHANSVIKSKIFQLARRDDEDRYLHLIAFIAHQSAIAVAQKESALAYKITRISLVP